jgi:MscS family membrane protein
MNEWALTRGGSQLLDAVVMKMHRPFSIRFFRVLLIALWFFAPPFQLPAMPPQGSASSPSDVSQRKDPLGRETPRSTVLNFVKYAHRGDFKSAAKFLQLSTANQKKEGEQLARELLTLMNTSLHSSISLMSDSPEGFIDDSPDVNIEAVGKFVVNDQEAKILLIRVTQGDSGPIWLISSQTLAQVPSLYESAGSPALDRYLPDALAETSFLGISLGRWLAFLLSIPLAILLGWAVGHLPRWLHWNRKPLEIDGSRFAAHSPRRPIQAMMAILFHAVLVIIIGMPIYYRVYYFRGSAILFVLCAAWLGLRILDRVYASRNLRSRDRNLRSFFQLVHQLLRVSLFTLAGLLVLALVGINTGAILAGVGIGGIALALAAQKTLENLFGGITLVMDRVFAVGDDCVITDRQVTIRDIGLRSITMSTRDGTEISFPNGMLSQNSIENLSRRTKFLISATLTIGYESTLTELGDAVTNVREMLKSHERVEHESARFHLSGLSSLGYEVELFAYVRGADAMEFSAIREDVLCRVLEILESRNARMAIPARVNYVSMKSPNGQAGDLPTEPAHETSRQSKHAND